MIDFEYACLVREDFGVISKFYVRRETSCVNLPKLGFEYLQKLQPRVRPYFSQEVPYVDFSQMPFRSGRLVRDRRQLGCRRRPR